VPLLTAAGPIAGFFRPVMGSHPPAGDSALVAEIVNRLEPQPNARLRKIVHQRESSLP
jgi:hypothetical protein